MKKVLLIFFILLSSCNKPISTYKVINFDENLSFEEFKKKVENYANKNEYPNINK